MCQSGVIDSKEYIKEALKYLKEKIVHISITIETKTPKMAPKIEEMRQSISELLKVQPNQIGITATTGEGLTEFRKRAGNKCICNYDSRIKEVN